MTIGEKIKAKRKSIGWTQTELGQRLGVKTNAVSKWECGRVEQIPTSKIKAMAALFDVQPSYLIDDGEKPTPEIESGLSADEIEVLNYYRQLSPERKEDSRIQLKALADRK